MSLTILHDGLGRDSRTMAAQLHRHGLASHAERARIAAALVALAPVMEPLPPAPPSPGLFDE